MLRKNYFQSSSSYAPLMRETKIRRTILGDISNAYRNGLTKTKNETKMNIGMYNAGIMEGIDIKFANNTLYVPEYASSIIKHLYDVEKNFQVSPTYMNRQSEISSKMRSVLIDWLVDVHYKFKLQPQTFFLMVNYIDRYLELKIIPKCQLQLVGVTALFIAAKYEEIYFPTIKDLCFITANTYTREDIIHMEIDMVDTLRFNLTVPTVYSFLCRYIQVLERGEEYNSICYFLAERTQQEYNLLPFLPSLIASCCILLANRYMNYKEEWDSVLQHYTHYTQKELEKCSELIEYDIIHTPTNLPVYFFYDLFYRLFGESILSL